MTKQDFIEKEERIFKKEKGKEKLSDREVEMKNKFNIGLNGNLREKEKYNVTEKDIEDAKEALDDQRITMQKISLWKT